MLIELLGYMQKKKAKLNDTLEKLVKKIIEVILRNFLSGF